MRLIKWVRAGFLASTILMGISQAQIPSLIAYQGILTDNGGNPVPDAANYPITFTIYDDSLLSGVNLLWTETQSVSIRNSMFGTMFGSVTSLSSLAFNKQYYLGVTRNGTELKPRLRLLSSPYSRRAAIADSASKADTAKYARSSGSLNVTSIVGKIDSSKIADSAVTSSKIKDGTILSQDVSNSFKAPKAGLADSTLNADTAKFAKAASISDTAKWIKSSAITNGMIGTAQISSIEGSKIVPRFGKQIISSDTAIEIKGEIFQNGLYYLSKETPHPGFDTIQISFNAMQNYDGGYHEIKFGGRRQEPNSSVFCHIILSWAVASGDSYNVTKISEFGINTTLASWSRNGDLVTVKFYLEPSFLVEGGIQIITTNKTNLTTFN